jgi:hypothetical protein
MNDCGMIHPAVTSDESYRLPATIKRAIAIGQIIRQREFWRAAYSKQMPLGFPASQHTKSVFCGNTRANDRHHLANL